MTLQTPKWPMLSLFWHKSY